MPEIGSGPNKAQPLKVVQIHKIIILAQIQEKKYWRGVIQNIDRDVMYDGHLIIR